MLFALVALGVVVLGGSAFWTAFEPPGRTPPPLWAGSPEARSQGTHVTVDRPSTPSLLQQPVAGTIRDEDGSADSGSGGGGDVSRASHSGSGGDSSGSNSGPGVGFRRRLEWVELGSGWRVGRRLEWVELGSGCRVPATTRVVRTRVRVRVRVTMRLPRHRRRRRLRPRPLVRPPVPATTRVGRTRVRGPATIPAVRPPTRGPAARTPAPVREAATTRAARARARVPAVAAAPARGDGARRRTWRVRARPRSDDVPRGPGPRRTRRQARGRRLDRLRPWASRKTSCSARSRSATSGSSGCGSPTCSGFLKSVAVAPAELEGAFAEGIGFDGSAIEGFARVYESDMLAKPDPATFQILPWRGEGPATARMFCDIVMPDGSPSYADPRYVLKRTLTQGRRPGLHLLHPPRDRVLPLQGRRRARQPSPMPVDQQRLLRPHRRSAWARDFRREAITMLEAMGISVEFSHHEGGPGQQEIDLRYADALTTADNIMTFRTVVKEVALEPGHLRDLHAQAVHRAPRLRHAHPPVAVRGRPQRLLRGRRASTSCPRSAGTFIAGLLAARRRDHRRHQPVGQLLQAAAAAAARRRRTSAGATTTARRWSGCRCTSRTRASRPGSSCARIDSAVQPLPGLRA